MPFAVRPSGPRVIVERQRCDTTSRALTTIGTLAHPAASRLPPPQIHPNPPTSVRNAQVRVLKLIEGWRYGTFIEVPCAVLERLELLHVVSNSALRIGDMCYLTRTDSPKTELYIFQQEEDPPPDQFNFLWTYMRSQRWFGWQRLEVEDRLVRKDMSAAVPFHAGAGIDADADASTDASEDDAEHADDDAESSEGGMRGCSVCGGGDDEGLLLVCDGCMRTRLSCQRPLPHFPRCAVW